MTSALVLCAYFAMLLSPCVVATYGDLLSVRWIFALARRRRTHRAESLLVSFREERYAMAVALEASFASANSDLFEAPKPFLIPRRSPLLETPAFLQGRQRVAARLAQMAVAQKLRAASETPAKVVAIPPDVAAPALLGTHIRPRKPELVALVPEPAHEAAHRSTHLVFREDAAEHIRELERELEEVAASAASSPSRAHQGPAPVPPRRKPGDSNSLHIAA